MSKHKKAPANLKAYKTYIINSPSHFKIERYWDINAEGEFYISSSCINKLIRNALKKGFKFPHNSFNETTDHGKGIQKTLEDLGIKTDEYSLSDFSTLLGLKSFTDFINDQELLKQYVELANKPNPITNKSKSVFAYVLHMWINNDIERTVFDVQFSSMNELSVASYNENYSFFQNTEHSKPSDIPSGKMNQSNQLKIKQLGNHYFIFDTGKSAFSITINTTDGNIWHKNYLFCTYSFIDAGIPVCGIGIIKKVYQVDISKIMQSPIEPIIRNLLFQRTNWLTKDEILFSQKQGDYLAYKNDFFENGHKFVGFYTGFYLDDDFEEDKALRTLTMEIVASGEIRIHDGEVGHEEKRGFCSITNEIIYITCDYKGDSRIPRLIIVLDIPQAKNLEGKFELKGIYGGFSTSNKPFIGLIRFKRVQTDLTQLPLENRKKDAALKNFKIKQQKEALTKGQIDLEILNYFKEELFYRSPERCIDRKILDSLLNTNTDNNYVGPTGNFYIYSSSAAKKGIIRYPLIIKSNGEAKIKSITGTEESGYATIYFSNFLFINFHTKESYVKHHSLNRPNKGFFIFYPTHKKNVKIIPGISLRINNDNKVQAKREFLVSIETGTSKQRKSKLSCEAIMPKDPKFKELPEKLRSTLLGREYNLIVVSDDLENEEKILQRENFSEIYSYYALFEYLKKMKGKNSSQKIADRSVTSFIKLAIEHGFINKQMFIKSIREFSKIIKLDFEQKKKLEAYFSQIIDKELKDYYEVPVG